jgi:outer membrane immunogenic protein
MQKVQKLLGATMLAALLGTGGTASAADLYAGGSKDVPVYYPPLWTGFYLGANMGLYWANLDLGRFGFVDGAGNATVLGGNKIDTTNGFGGGQFGYNWQTGTWVFGIEVDLGAASINARPHFLGETLTPAGTMSRIVSLDGNDNNFHFTGDVTGRIGYTWGGTMIYAKGGFAFLQTNLALRETTMDGTGLVTVFNGNNNGDNYLTGWTVGGGLEWKVSPSWSIKAEYLHFDFTDFNTNCCGDGLNNWNNKHDLTADTVKIGFNYFWNPPVQPLK